MLCAEMEMVNTDKIKANAHWRRILAIENLMDTRESMKRTQIRNLESNHNYSVCDTLIIPKIPSGHL